MALEWIRHNQGYATTKCRRFEMSLAATSKGPRYTVFARTTDPLNPLECIGFSGDANRAREKCEKYLLEHKS